VQFREKDTTIARIEDKIPELVIGLHKRILSISVDVEHLSILSANSERILLAAALPERYTGLPVTAH